MSYHLDKPISIHIFLSPTHPRSNHKQSQWAFNLNFYKLNTFYIIFDVLQQHLSMFFHPNFYMYQYHHPIILSNLYINLWWLFFVPKTYHENIYTSFPFSTVLGLNFKYLIWSIRILLIWDRLLLPPLLLIIWQHRLIYRDLLSISIQPLIQPLISFSHIPLIEASRLKHLDSSPCLRLPYNTYW